MPDLVTELGHAALDLLGVHGYRAPPTPFEQAVDIVAMREHGMVVAYHPIARDIGLSVLAAGGNAFDALIAAIAAENVLAEGASTFAGSLGVLIYEAQDGRVSYLDAEFNDPLSRDALWTPQRHANGRAVLVPGVPAGLEELARRHGRMALADLLQPAIRLADEGFAVGALMALTIAERAAILKRMDYGRRTFFRNGAPLRVGETLRQPELAEFLRGLAREGSAYVYQGEFGERFVDAVAIEGGRLGAADLAAYQPRWCPPWHTTYRSRQVYASSGRSYGGLWALLALKTLEHASLPSDVHYSEDADTLKLLMRVAHEVWSEEFLYEDVMKAPEETQRRLDNDYTRQLWQRMGATAKFTTHAGQGPHSFNLIALDRTGNIASATVTAESDPWADGIFVDGLFLTNAGRIPWSTAPGERRISPLAIHLVLQDARPRFVLGTISNSVVEAAFQILVNLIDYGLPPHKAVAAPRFGTFPPKRNGGWSMPNLTRNWIDPRIDRRVVRASELRTRRRGLVDTGLGAVLALDDNGQHEGALVPIPYLPQPFSTGKPA